MRLAPGDLLAPELDSALARVQEAEDRLDQGRLARPVGSDDGHDLALADVDRDAVEDVGLGDVAGDHVLGAQHHLALAVAAHRPGPVPAAAEVGVDHRLVGANLVRLAVGDHRALGHHDHPVGVVHDHLHVVLDEQEGDPVLGAQALHVVEQPAPEGRVDPGHRLVEEQEAGLRHQRPGELEQLALASGEGARVLVRELGQVEHVEQLDRLLVDLALARAPAERPEDHVGEPLARLVGRRQHHVVDHRHRRQRLGDLEGPHHSQPGDHVRRSPLDLAAVEHRPAAIRAVEAGDQVEEGRLAGAVGADQGRDRAPLDVHRRPADRLDAAEVLDDLGRFEDLRGAVRAPGRGRRGGVGRRRRLVSHRGPSPPACRRRPAAGTPSTRSRPGRG